MRGIAFGQPLRFVIARPSAQEFVGWVDAREKRAETHRFSLIVAYDGFRFAQPILQCA